MKNHDTLPTDAWYEKIEARLTRLESLLDAEEKEEAAPGR